MRRRSNPAGTSVDRTPAWWELAVCGSHGDPAWWFSEVRADIERAKAYCGTCPVRETCLRENLREPFGVFGGLGPDDRRQVAKTVPKPAPPAPAHGTSGGYKQCRQTPGGPCGLCQEWKRATRGVRPPRKTQSAAPAA